MEEFVQDINPVQVPPVLTGGGGNMQLINNIGLPLFYKYIASVILLQIAVTEFYHRWPAEAEIS